MVSRFLVTTALEETWPQVAETPVLFLGEWCRLYSRKERWSGMNAKVLPYHWDNREKLYRDYLYLRDFYERILPFVGEKLNEIHNVDHSTRYWRILVGPWLGFFLQILFDRWTSIHQAIEQYEIDGTTLLDFLEETMIPQEMQDFIGYLTSDEWNHYLYAIILQQITYIEFQVKPVRDSYKFNGIFSKKQTLKLKLKKQIFYYLSQILSPLGRKEDAFFISTYLPFSKQWQLDLKLGQFPQFREHVPISSSDINLKKRDWFVELEGRSDFERFSTEILAQQIPAAYLEGYASLVQQVKHNDWPKRPKVIWTSNSESMDDHFKTYAAEKTEQGIPLVIGQHGGHYGMGLWSFSEDHHLVISDRYLSWGWAEEQQPKIRPVGNLKQNRRREIDLAKQNRILLVTSTIPRYSYWMLSAYVSRQWLDYLNDQFAFCQTLPPELRKTLKVRLSKYDFNWEQVQRWKDRWSEVEIDQGEQRIDKLVRKCRIYVSSYNATTYLESFIMNVPTVLFWNPNHWELRDSAKPYFESLKEVGIFHETPESAAQHITKVWDRVDEWWTRKAVTDAVKQFCERYSKTPKDIVHELYKELNEYTTKHGHVQ